MSNLAKYATQYAVLEQAERMKLSFNLNLLQSTEFKKILPNVLSNFIDADGKIPEGLTSESMFMAILAMAGEGATMLPSNEDQVATLKTIFLDQKKKVEGEEGEGRTLASRRGRGKTARGKGK